MSEEKPHILLVEDEMHLARGICFNLEQEGYRVSHVGSGEDALKRMEYERFALIILDIMLPGMDGFEVCRILRRESPTPILMLTARDDEIDRVVGLELGADDYLTKPFSMRELMARVKAQLRRSRFLEEELARRRTPEAAEQDVLAFGNLAINRTRGEATLDGNALQLRPQEYQLLLFFAEHKGQMLSRDFVLERLWGWDFTGDSRTVDVHVRWLRQKIEADPSHPERIVTVRGGGYRFEG